MISSDFTRFCSALIPGEMPSFGCRSQGSISHHEIEEMYGGLWVGGRIQLEQQNLVFRPNRLNNLVHLGPVEISIPRNEIQEIVCESGWILGSVVVIHTQGLFQFRCFGAKMAARKLSRAIPSI